MGRIIPYIMENVWNHQLDNGHLVVELKWTNHLKGSFTEPGPTATTSPSLGFSWLERFNKNLQICCKTSRWSGFVGDNWDNYIYNYLEKSMLAVIIFFHNFQQEKTLLIHAWPSA